MKPDTGTAPPSGPLPDPLTPVDEGIRENVTALLAELAGGDGAAADAIFPLLYEELRRIAHRRLRSERSGHTLCTTALVHEAYLRMVDQSRARWVNRAQFLCVASRAMRRILIDYARRFRAEKRGGDRERVDLEDVDVPVEERAGSLIALDDALRRLEAVNPRLSQVVECRFFGGMTEEEVAAALALTDRTVRRDWVKAKALLREALASPGEPPGSRSG